MQYVYLYIYLKIKPGGRASITCNAVYGYTFIYNLDTESEAFFYNVPYFKKALTAFWQAEAVHLGVSSRRSHCIIMRLPAPKCYFAGRDSSLKLPHYYNFPNFYFLHYCQQDFITYLECKQA